MSVNGVTNVSSTDNYTKTRATSTVKQEKAAENTSTAPKKDNGVVYEPSDSTAQKTKTYKPDKALIAKMQADADARMANLESLVQKMISNQGNSYGQANDIWKLLSGGNLTVSAAAKAQAQKDIGEDGYWGVNQTSDRIVDFAKALTGGDPDQIDKMRSAFEKGFKQATGAWGKDLPSISNDTYKAVMEKFDKWSEESKSAANNENTNVSQV